MAETLKQYLIDIGFKVDKLAQQQAEEATKRAEERATDRAEKEAEKRAKIEAKEVGDREKAAALAAKREQERYAKSLNNFRSFSTRFLGIQAALGAVTGITALGIVRAVDQAARSAERLNYLGKRSGTSATNASAFGYASSQLGSSTEEANASLEAFGRNLRTNGTGYAQSLDRVLSRIGKSSKDAKGHLRDSTELATDLGEALRHIQEHGGKSGYATAMATAQSFGFGENQARAMMDRGFRGREDEFRSDHKKVGADPDAAAAAGTAFEQSMRHLKEVLDAIGMRLSTALFEKLRPLLDQLAEWFVRNADRVAGFIGRLADDVLKLAKAIGEQIGDADWDKILNDFHGLASGFGALASKLGGKDGNGGLIALLALLALRLGALTRLVLPPWLQAILGLSIATDMGVANEKKPGLMNKWDGEAHGLSGDAEGGADDAARFKGSQYFGKAFRHRPRWLGGDGGGRRGFHNDRLRGSGGAGQAPPVPNGNPGDLTRLTEEAAQAAGIDPRIMHGIRAGESGHGSNYDHNGGTPGRPEDSWGPWQLNRHGGLGVDFERETAEERKRLGYGGLEDPRTLRLQAFWVARYLKKRGRGALSQWHGYRGDMDANPAWGNSGYAPKPVVKTPPMLRPGGPKMPAPPTDAPAPSKTSLGPTPLQRMQIATSLRGSMRVSHTPTFNIEGGHERPAEIASLQPERGAQDLLRNVQGAES